MKLIYFGIYYAVKIHDSILDKSGGMSGTLDLGRLESVLTHIQNDDYYSTPEEKLTHLVFAVNKGHLLCRRQQTDFDCFGRIFSRSQWT